MRGKWHIVVSVLGVCILAVVVAWALTLSHCKTQGCATSTKFRIESYSELKNLSGSDAEWAQVWISGFGLIGVALTVLFAWRAWQAARDTLLHEQRPFLTLEPNENVPVEWSSKTGGIRLPNCVIRNHGRGAGVVTAIYREWRRVPADSILQPIEPVAPSLSNTPWQKKTTDFAVGPESASPPLNSLGGSFCDDVKCGDWLYFIGYIEYSDTERKRRFTAGFCYVFRTDDLSRGLHLALPAGSGRFNYNHQTNSV